MIDFVQARERMVQEQLVRRGIKDSHVLRAMAEVPRHLFIESELCDHAYENRPLPIDANQTISQPFIVARMVEALELKGTERVLEVGTGSGYAAAILGELCTGVFSIEVVRELALKTRTLLISQGYTNVSVVVGDGSLGLEEQAPYDAVVFRQVLSATFLPATFFLAPSSIMRLGSHS